MSDTLRIEGVGVDLNAGAGVGIDSIASNDVRICVVGDIDTVLLCRAINIRA